jgi:serpin B
LLPSFKLETSYGLNDTFRNLGMPTAFSNQADFSGITTQERLAVSDIIHKAFIEVDETGTEAAAATGIVVSVTSAIIDPIPPKTFRADHPFIFMIEDTRNGNVLFMGKVMNPKQ